MNNDQKQGNVSFNKFPKNFIDQFLSKPYNTTTEPEVTITNEGKISINNS
jgi:hypothetical protein